MINVAFAASQQAAQSSPLGFFVPLILVFLVFFFLVIRPQRQKYKKHMATLDAIKVGDVVVTGGGVVGKVSGTPKSDELLVEIAPSVEIKVIRKTVSEVMPRPGRSPASSKTVAKSVSSSRP